MTQYPDVLFNKSPDQLRRLGAYGGRAFGRNHRARMKLASRPSATVRPTAALRETAAEAIHRLDAQFPWLSGAETHLSGKPEHGVRARRGQSRVDCETISI
jgi:hypothetical protein